MVKVVVMWVGDIWMCGTVQTILIFLLIKFLNQYLVVKFYKLYFKQARKATELTQY